jgi:23S rRNA pseudouridine2605 synthase
MVDQKADKSDEKGRKNVAQLVSSCGKRVWPVGRLDLDSEGLLILTDDGDLTQKLIHPSHEIEKEYLVWVTGDAAKGIPILSAPMELDGDRLAPAKVRKGRVSGGVTQLSITIHQGKNRQVRRMCAKAGLEVLRLKRIREGKLNLDRTLAVGAFRHLTEEEVKLLAQES